MKVTTKNAINNKRVKLISDKYRDTSYNPVWGGKYGKVLGTIKGMDAVWILVEWDNGTRNSYEDNTLEFDNTQFVSLENALQTVINDFVKDSKVFSGYDIVSSLRKMVNEKVIILNDRQEENVDGIMTQRISREETREIIRNYMNNISGYYRDFNGDYIEYKPVKIAQTPVVVYKPDSTKKQSISTKAYSGFVDIDKLKTYVKHKKNPTLKQIQSRFKGISVTVRQLGSDVVAAGLTLSLKDPYCKSQVTE